MNHILKSKFYTSDFAFSQYVFNTRPINGEFSYLVSSPHSLYRYHVHQASKQKFIVTKYMFICPCGASRNPKTGRKQICSDAQFKKIFVMRLKKTFSNFRYWSQLSVIVAIFLRNLKLQNVAAPKTGLRKYLLKIVGMRTANSNVVLIYPHDKCSKLYFRQLKQDLMITGGN